MNRREFVRAGAALYGSFSMDAVARASPSDFDSALQAYSRNVKAIDAARQFRELKYRAKQALETQGGMVGRRSRRSISQRAINLIVVSEISSSNHYRKSLMKPTWPHGNSGITIGIGYDIGYVNEISFAEHWRGLLRTKDIIELQRVCGLKGELAGQARDGISDVEIGWDAAKAQFGRYLPYIIAETEDHYPNCGLLSADSLGALVSLVYNRGSDHSQTRPKRAEMFAIYKHMERREFSLVPGEILSMRRHWLHDPKARGLLERRRLEAELFEKGLSA